MNALPNKDITPKDLWNQVTKLPRAHRVVDFPRKDKDGNHPKVAIWVLSQNETIECTAATENFVRKFYKDQCGVLPNKDDMSGGYSTIFENRASMEILFMCCRDPQDLNKSFFQTVNAVGNFTNDEIAVLMQHYLIIKSQLGPIIAELSQVEMDAWISRLTIGGEAANPLGSLSLGQLSSLLMYMASQLKSSQTDS